MSDLGKRRLLWVLTGIGQAFWAVGLLLFLAGFLVGVGARGWPFFVIGIVSALPFSLTVIGLSKRWGIELLDTKKGITQ